MGMMDIRRRILEANDHVLVAPGYKRVEYIQNTAYSRIATDYVPTQYDEFEVEYMHDRLTTSNEGLFSAGTGTYQLIALSYGSSVQDIRYYCRYFSSGSAENYIARTLPNVWYKMTVTTDGKFHVNNNTSSGKPYEHELDGTDTTLWIFRRRNGNNAFRGKLKSFKVTNNGILKLNLIPCVRLTDSVAGAYDTVSKTFYSSPAGNEPFIPGKDFI